LNTQTIMVTSTYPTKEEAMHAGKAVVELRLVACAQVSSPITSIYHWQGEICTESEFRLVLKTTISHEEELIYYLKNNHSYEVPEIVTTHLTGGSEEFLLWIKNETV